MIFIYKQWNKFCANLSDAEIFSIPAKDVAVGSAKEPYLVLKHDVETNVKKALEIAKIEHRYGHRGSYYVQAYLLRDERNIQCLREIQNLGHEVSYHYDVMDSNKGNINCAIDEFDANVQMFLENGFEIVTLCQHGNPVVERVGYHSNRDFFRNKRVQARYPEYLDIMVDFKEKAKTDYLYFSDAGREFNLIYDPINNDIVKSDDKNIKCRDLEEVMEKIGGNNEIISIHPHRWASTLVDYILKTALFRGVRTTARVAMKISVFKKLMGKYYYLAKKI